MQPPEYEKPCRPKSREVSSRFLSPVGGIPWPNRAVSPSLRKNALAAYQKHRKGVDEIGAISAGLWPSAAASGESSSSKSANTLADHLGNERMRDVIMELKEPSRGGLALSRQRSCSESGRFGNEKQSQKNEKKEIEIETHKENRPIIGGSMRYSSKVQVQGVETPLPTISLTPGRISVDDRKQSRRKSEADLPSSDSEPSEIFSGTDYGSPSAGARCSFSTSSSSYVSSTGSSRKSGINIPSRFMNRTRRGSDSGDNSPIHGSTIKNSVKRANSTNAYGSSMSQWALSPGRTVSPPISGDSNGKPIQSFSSFTTSRSKTKGTVGSFISLGLDLLKGRKSSSSPSLSIMAANSGEASHKLRLLHNHLLQWRFVNANTKYVNQSKKTQSEMMLLNAYGSLSKLQSSVMQRRIQLEKERLDFKVNNILSSQMKQLEVWAEIEQQHLSAISVTKDGLHAVTCRVPLIEGAKVDSHQTYVSLHQASDLILSITTILNSVSFMAQKTTPLLSELANVVVKEHGLLQEWFDWLGTYESLELQEKSLRCQIMQLQSQKLSAYGTN